MSDDWVNQTDRPGYLRLYGRESLGSTFRQSLIARRVQTFRTVTSTCLEFEPGVYQQVAGLVCYYNTFDAHYLYGSGGELGESDARKYLSIITSDKYEQRKPTDRVDITGVDCIYLRADFDGEHLQFYYAVVEGEWKPIGPVLDGSILSDDYVEGSAVHYRACFTGAFVGLCR